MNESPPIAILIFTNKASEKAAKLNSILLFCKLTLALYVILYIPGARFPFGFLLFTLFSAFFVLSALEDLVNSASDLSSFLADLFSSLDSAWLLSISPTSAGVFLIVTTAIHAVVMAATPGETNMQQNYILDKNSHNNH